MHTLYASNHWIATYTERSDGKVVANIIDNNGKQYAYQEVFDSVSALKNFLESK